MVWSNYSSRFRLTTSRTSQGLRWCNGVIVVLVAGLLTAVTYAQGGAQTGLPHLFDLLVIGTAVLYGRWIGLGLGLVAGLLAGPFMPLNTVTGASQPVERWVIQLLTFVLVGYLTGVLATALRRRSEELVELNEQTLFTLVQTIDAKCHYTALHSRHVAEHAVMIAAQLGLPAEEIERVRWAALLHDIGKLSTPGEILDKPGSLAQSEQAILRQHPVESARILEGIRHFQACLPAVRHHHERFDGRGYPDGLSGQSIPIEARILAVADAYDAMTSDRAYRPAMSESRALQLLRQESGAQFDPVVVAALVEARQPEARQQSRVAGEQRATRALAPLLAGRSGATPPPRAASAPH